MAAATKPAQTPAPAPQSTDAKSGDKIADVQTGTEPQAQDHQQQNRDDNGTPAQSLPRNDAPANIAGGNAAAPTQTAMPDPVKVDLPQNFAANSVQQPMQILHNTAATLHSVNALRDTAPMPPNLQSMAVQIASYADKDIKHFEIRMDPPELGRVEVRLTLDDTGKAHAALVVDKPHALDMLQKDSAGLERALKDAGINLSNNGLNFSLKGQERQQDNNARAASRHAPPASRPLQTSKPLP